MSQCFHITYWCESFSIHFSTESSTVRVWNEYSAEMATMCRGCCSSCPAISHIKPCCPWLQVPDLHTALLRWIKRSAEKLLFYCRKTVLSPDYNRLLNYLIWREGKKMELLKQIFLSCLPQIFQAQPLLSTSLTCFLVASILLMSTRFLKKESRIWSCLLHRLQVCVVGCCCTLKAVGNLLLFAWEFFCYLLPSHLLFSCVYCLKQLLMHHPTTQWKV